MKPTLGRFSTFALLAIVVPAIAVAVLGYVSLRQWERSAELLFQAQARDMAAMAAGKVTMVLRRAEDELVASVADRVAAADWPGVEALVHASPLIDRLYVLNRRGALLSPGRWRDGDASLVPALVSSLVTAAWTRGERRDAIAGDRPFLLTVVNGPGAEPVLVVLAPSLDGLRRDVFARTLGGLEAPTIVAILDHAERTVYSALPLAGAERLTTVDLGDALPHWRLALYQSPVRSPRQAVRRQVAVFTAALGVLLAIIVAGIATTYRLMRRETEMAQLKADFVANVSHDLKTPLSVIRMFGETLEMGRVASDGQRKEYYHVITRESERLSRLIENVLDFSRIEGGRRVYERVPTPLEPLIRETMESFAYPLTQGGFKVEVDVAPDLPDVAIDADAVGQALANLVDNAIKYAGARRLVRVEAAVADGGVAMSVVDEGLGIPRDQHAKIFEKFYRVGRSDTQGRRGSGVGLALVEHVIAAHGGRVTVESEPGRGSRFTIWLPIDDRRRAEAARA